MNNGFYYQLLSGLSRESNRFNYPRYLRDLVRTGELDEVKTVEETLFSEITESNIQDAKGAEYFLHLSELALLFALYRENYTGFDELADTIEKRLNMLRGTGGSFPDIDGWLWYLGYVRVAAKRLVRHITIEQWELEIDNIEWDELNEQLIKKISGVTGFVYLNEEAREKFNKGRFWLEQSIAGEDLSSSMAYYMNLADFFLAEGGPETAKRIEEHIKVLENTAGSTHDPNLSRLYRAAVMELKARALVFRKADADDDMIRIEENLRAVRDVEKNVDYEGKKVPAFVRAFLKLTFANYYLSLTSASELDREEIEDLVAMAIDDVMEALSISRRIKDESLRQYMNMERLRVASERNTKVNEKDFKEVLSAIRKGNNFPAQVNVSGYFARYYRNLAQSLKDQAEVDKAADVAKRAFDVLLELQKRGANRLDEGGFYLVVNAMGLINDLLYAETHQPGVSWVVHELDQYFATIAGMIDDYDQNMDTFGFSLFQAFRREFITFEAVSHFNIKVYLSYQYYEMKMLRLSALVNQDKGAEEIADRLVKEVGDVNSPLHFVTAQWDEFKNVPNSVRNKVLNKCISISKGDLPLAASHLDFSYRNLRSYITFKEVNRLGFFLEEQDTKIRQLEQGIRLMFFDLYKRGTIFEVVFDMPKFLVDHSKGGFSSQDLEEALNIKGTTAKKYIKIMMEIGLIKLERSVGRKHFYKLRKDNVMNRLGQDQKVLTVAD